jgi:hypothetical protein
MSQPTRSPDEEFDVLLQDALTGGEKDAPARPHIREVREQLLARCAPVRSARPQIWKWTRRGFAAAAAAALLLAVFVVRNPSAGAWDELRTALRSVPWVHAEVQGPDNFRMENWISARRSVAAARAGEWVVYDDFRLGIRHEYRPDDGKLYRLALDDSLTKSFADAMDVLGQFMRGDDEVSTAGGVAEVVDQSKREINEDGRKVTEYTIALRLSGGREVTTIVRVDPASGLPQTATIQSADQADVTCRFDYPEFGPEDVYALGVSRDVAVVDRLPSPDLQRIAAGVLAGRRDFDDYYCVAVQSAKSRHWSRTNRMYRTWRKGDCWRIEQSFSDARDDRQLWEQELPGDDVDRREYWAERVRQTRFYPVIVCDGRHIYRFQHEFSEPDEGRITFETTTAERDYMDFDREFGMLPLFTPAPELEGHRATLGGVTGRVAERLIAEPERGPDGTVLVEREYLDRRGQPHKQDLHRFWIDPVNGYLVMRSEMVDLDSDPPEVMQFREILEYDRSPRGHFFPTVLKWDEAGKMHYYVDFDVDIDEAIFSPDATGSVTGP